MHLRAPCRFAPRAVFEAIAAVLVAVIALGSLVAGPARAQTEPFAVWPMLRRARRP